MNQDTFASLLDAVRTEIHGHVAPHGIAEDDGVVAVVAQIVALSRCTIEASTIPDRDDPRIVVSPEPTAGSLAERLAHDMAACAALPFGNAPHREIDAAAPLDDAGFARLAARLAATEQGRTALDAVADAAATAINDLYCRSSSIKSAHIKAILARDLEIDTRELVHVSQTTRWTLCHHLNGDPLRSRTILRRRQALETYGIVAPELMKPSVTAVIDQAEQLAPVLCRLFGIDQARLRRMTRVQPLVQTLRSTEYVDAVRQLVAYEVPAHQWPTDWPSSVWAKARTRPILSPAILAGKTDADDALKAFTLDVIRPLAAGRAEALGLDPTKDRRLGQFLQVMDLPSDLRDGEVRRMFHRGMTQAILGPRGAKAFHEGVAVWHRRAACAAALRHESQTENPHWPAICPTWTSKDGLHQAVPLTTAEALVEEGNAQNHCVGGYYDVCRSGRTHIVSMRRNGSPVGTLELLATFAKGKLVQLSPGQFEAKNRARPDRDVREAAKAFLDDLGMGVHPTNSKEVAAHAKRIAREYDTSWRFEALPTEHAERTWALYRPLMPRPFAATAAEWAETSGFGRTMDAVLLAIAGRAGEGAEPEMRMAA